MEPCNPEVRLVSVPNPFGLEQVCASMPLGCSVAEIVLHGCLLWEQRQGLSLGAIARYAATYGVVSVDGEHIPSELWRDVYPEPGQLVTFRIRPMGGNPLNTILTLVVVAVAAIAAPAIGGAIAGALFSAGTAAFTITAGIVGGLVGTGIMMLGTMLVNAVAPIRPAGAGAYIPPATSGLAYTPISGGGGGTGGDKPAFSIQGGSNQANPFGPVPVVMGRFRRVPEYGGQPYTEVVGASTYQRALVVWGYGFPLQISDIKIGDTPINLLPGVEVRTFEWKPDGSTPLKLYSRTVKEENVNITLRYRVAHVVTTDEADEISWTVACPGGLFSINKKTGDRQDAWNRIRVRYRPHGESAWLPIWDFDLRANSMQAVTRSGNISVSRGKYDIEVTRLTPDFIGTEVIDTMNWTTLRWFRNESPLKFPYPVTVSEFRIKASDQINGAVSQISGIAQSVVPDWNGSSWVSRATSNPASLMRAALTCDANERRRSTGQVDDIALQDFHTFCAQNGFTYNRIHDFTQSVYDMAADIASAGRAFPDLTNGKWGVAIDRKQNDIVQLITPRNSWGFTLNRASRRIPHALRMQFNDQTNDWRIDERLVYDDGYNNNNATIYESFAPVGVTDPKLIYKAGREYIAAARLRPETIQIKMGAEHLVAGLRQRVRVAHDVLMRGQTQGRIKSLWTVSEVLAEADLIEAEGNDAEKALLAQAQAVSTGADDTRIIGIETDQSCIMADGQTWGLQIRKADGKTLDSRSILTVPGEWYTLTLQAPVAASAGIKEGMLWAFGPSGQEAGDYIITHIDRTNDLIATLTLLDYAPAIYDAASGPIPEWNPGTTMPINVGALRPTPPENVNVSEAIIMAGGNAANITLFNWTPSVNSPVPVDTYQAQILYPGSGDWRELSRNADLGTEITGLAPGVYGFRVRSLSASGVTSTWVTIPAQKILGMNQPLPDVTGLTTIYKNKRIVLVWSPVEDYRQISYEVRRGNTWDTGQRVIITPSLECLALSNGLYWVKAKSGQAYSVNPTGLEVEGADALMDNVVVRFDEADDLWPGDKDMLIPAGENTLILAGGDFREVPDLRVIKNIRTVDIGSGAGFYTIEEARTVYLSSDSECQIDILVDSFAIRSLNVREFFDFRVVEDLRGQTFGLHSAIAQIMVRTAGVWGQWENFYPGTYYGDAFRFRVKLESFADDITAGISQFKVLLDVPDRMESYAGIAVPVPDEEGTGYVITFSRPWNAPPTMVASIIDATGLEDVEFVNEEITETEAHIRGVRNSDGVYVAKSINVYFQGY